MAMREASGGAFRFGLRDDGEDLVESSWQGHIDVAGLRAFCALLERRASRGEPFGLLIDSRAVTGYDPDARAVASAFARGRHAENVLAVALVVDSQLAGIESPAVALALPQRARLFGSVDAARSYLNSRSVVRSGEYAIAGSSPSSRRASHE